MKHRIKDILTDLISNDLVFDDSIYGTIACTVPLVSFAKVAKALKKAGFRLVCEWAADETPFGRGYAVFAAFHEDKDYLLVRSEVSVEEPVFPTLTRYYPSAYRFERKINSLMGLMPLEHPDLRPWIKHEDWPQDAYPLRKSFDALKRMPREDREYKWIKAEGEGVFEIPVGPVHAGIIEPGHFRFQAMGEDILNLEKKLGYVHKGIEKRFESLPWTDAVRLAGRVSGDSTVAHAMAFCMAAESASGCVVPDRARYIRAIMLERERIANHFGDIGAICNDTGFAFLLYQFSILREKALKTNKAIFGHRLMMDRVALGGVNAELKPDGVEAMLSEISELSEEFERLVRIYDDNPSFEDRIYGAGVLSPELAKELGVVGFVARSSGQGLDCRIQNPFPPYDRFVPQVPVLTSGDVHARGWVRIEEARATFKLLNDMLENLPKGGLVSRWVPPQPGRAGFSAVEGWRGEIITWVQCGPDGGINRCMVRDPSWVNWLALEQAIKGNIVPDFPLCNKSFNQSYSGHDL